MSFNKTQFSPRAKNTSPLCQRQTPIAGAMRGVLLSLALGAGALPQLALAQAASTVLPAADAVKAFNVPAGPLGAALDRFARSAGVNLAYDEALIAGLNSRGLSGNYSVTAGLSALLAGSGVEALAQPGGYSLRKAAAPVATNSAEATLPAVRVSASGALPSELPLPYAGGQLARGGSLGLLGTAATLDVPFSTTNYTAELLENQQARTLADVVVNDASVRVLTASGGFGEDFQIRGFTVPSGDVGLDGL